MATTVLLVRHGETEWNRERRWQGQADPPLSELGRKQARALACELAEVPLRAIYSSDLRRARETAELVAGQRDMVVVTDVELREINDAEWTGLTWTEIERRFPEGARRHLAGETGWDGGETWEVMSDRVVTAVQRIAKTHPDDSVLCVAHGGPMRAVLAHAAGMDIGEYRRTQPHPANCSLAEIAVENGEFRRLD